MTREEHIKRAEWLIRRHSQFGVQHPTPHEVALAQVHATLALACPPAPTVPPAPEGAR